MSKNHYLIIGGTKGIGKQLTLSLSSQNNTTVSVISRRAPKNKEKVVGVSYFELDLSKRKEIPEVCDQVARTNGNLRNLKRI